MDEPFRWMEAIATRHSYVQDKIKKGQPVVGVPYKDGALLLGFAPQPGKVFEIYDRIAMGALAVGVECDYLLVRRECSVLVASGQEQASQLEARTDVMWLLNQVSADVPNLASMGPVADEIHGGEQ